MQGHRPRTKVIAGAALALVFTFTAQAQNNRSFVATTGNDANTCSASAFCRTFGRALAQTNPGGEIVVINSGGYGPATISQPVVITAIGIDASITAASGDALTINTTGNVTITGLNLHGQGTASNGVEIQQVGVLRLYNMLIENFTNAGVAFEAAGNLAIYGSAINDDLNGLLLDNNSANAYVHDTSFNHNATGVELFNGQMTINDSSAAYNVAAFSVNNTGTMTLFNDQVTSNNIALVTSQFGNLYFANCLIANNTTAYTIVGGTMASTSPGTSLIVPGQASDGTLGTVTLK
jgi:hypothetical protein